MHPTQQYANPKTQYAYLEAEEERRAWRFLRGTIKFEARLERLNIPLEMEVSIVETTKTGKEKLQSAILKAQTIYGLWNKFLAETSIEPLLLEGSFVDYKADLIDKLKHWALTSDKSTKATRSLRGEEQMMWLHLLAEQIICEKMILYKDKREVESQEGVLAFVDRNVADGITHYVNRRYTVCDSAKGINSGFKDVGLGAKDREAEDITLELMKEEILSLKEKYKAVNDTLKEKDLDPERKRQLEVIKQAVIDDCENLTERRQKIIKTRTELIQGKQSVIVEALDKVSQNALAAIEKSEQQMLAREEQRLLGNKEDETSW